MLPFPFQLTSFNTMLLTVLVCIVAGFTLAYFKNYKKTSDNLYAIDPRGRNRKKWAFETGNWVSSSPTIGSDGTIYVGSKDKTLYAISPDGLKNGHSKQVAMYFPPQR